MRNHSEIQESTRYTKEEINMLVDDNRNEIISFCKKSEATYADYGIYNNYEKMRILFNLNDNQCYVHVLGHRINDELYEGIEEGYVIVVYRFESGTLQDAAEKGLDSSLGDGKAEKLFRGYKDNEISEKEYDEKYKEIIQPWIDKFCKDNINETVKIEIDYLNAVDEAEWIKF